MGRRLGLLALAMLVLAGCGSGEERAAEPVAPPPASTSPTGGAQITGVGLDGEQISFGDFRGRPLLVNVWSSW